MEGSKRTTSRTSHFSSPTKNKQKNKKRDHFMTEGLLSNNTSNHFKFIMTSTRGKTCGLRRRNRTITLPSRKPRTATCSCNLCQVSLTSGWLLVTVRVLKVQRLE